MSKAKQSAAQSVAVITPTIGRQVWFWTSGARRAAAAHDPYEQPEAATVVYVHDERCVNLQVLDKRGRIRSQLCALLVQPEDSWDETTGPHCQWMPYQVKTAT